MELITEIFSRLPAKSMARFRCVSKLWGSIHRRLLFALERANHEFLFFSAHQPQQPYEKSPSSLVVAADFHTKISKDKSPEFRCLTSGLIYFSDTEIETGGDMKPVIYNPITGQYENLPKLSRYRKSYSFLGFDPVGNLYKVLFIAYPYCPDAGKHRILTLGTGKRRWRKIEFSLVHVPVCEGICINGVVYYIGQAEVKTSSKVHFKKRKTSSKFSEKYMIVCFDVRSEKFKVVDAECFCNPLKTTLINYKGKLAGTDLSYDDDTDAPKLCIWVLEDVERQEWSK
ncbi:hypothetical protein EUTSA_v10009610mg [Eutrema salsugineum]|uniref:F-box domain-containing protein n=1 Tax=Eutrema salsugineum TaxID=72664 RepID=V4K771_EUTSA|nr:hypothetical protein EUTSA_v10009610mg [Eutrema salsugineum]